MVLVCGIDEAGRGPVIGPLVMAGITIDEARSEELRSLGVKDSKLLSSKHRESLFEKIQDVVHASAIRVIPPWEVDRALQTRGMNLNWLEAHHSADIINVLKPQRAIIDCPSNNLQAYKTYLLNLLDNKKLGLKVEHKADVRYVECSAASVLAKVTRDSEIEKLKKHVGADFGSGYVADPLTKAFLVKNFRRHPELFRHTWAPYKELVAATKQKTLDI